MWSCQASLVVLAFLPALLWAADPYEGQREEMVRSQIQARGVRRPEVLSAMRQVPRHLFVPPDRARQAYNDHPLPIGEGQTISQPYIVAFMTELLEPEPHHRVLEIGAGSGYQAAVLAEVVRTVYTVEIVRSLGEQARERLRSLGYRNVHVRIGDGYAGWPEHAPFDRIILTAAPPEIPAALVEQLKPGGRLVAPVGRAYLGQDLVVLDKSLSGRISRRKVLPVLFVPMVQP
jgi:protein-L-isoaspartate(D-aspartate) O-methyltransferase